MRASALFLRWLPMPMLTAPLAILVLIGLISAVAIPLAQRVTPTRPKPPRCPSCPDRRQPRVQIPERDLCDRPEAGRLGRQCQAAGFLVAAHFKKMGAKVSEQPFTGRDPKSGNESTWPT